MQIIQSDGKIAVTYTYTPSSIPAYIFVIIFGTAAVVHLVLIFRFRAWFCISLLIGTTCEAFGYYGRVWSHSDVKNVKPYVLQYLLILPAPLFLAASVYMSLGRLAAALSATHHLPIQAKWLTKLFVLFDLLCFIIVMAGAGMESTISASIANIGSKVGVAGLFLQTSISMLFALVARIFHKRLQEQSHELIETAVRWRRYIWMLYFACFAIALRNLVRAVQEIQGFYGFVNGHEIFLYVFDAAMMAALVWWFAFFSPGVLLRRTATLAKVERQDPSSMEMPMLSDVGWTPPRRDC